MITPSSDHEDMYNMNRITPSEELLGRGEIHDPLVGKLSSSHERVMVGFPGVSGHLELK
jgi:hypothetical protein